jgi:crossover junction endodeoxyribonuclease RuvC
VRILGIDPGLVVSGYGVLEQAAASIRLIEAGTIDCGDAKRPLEQRLVTLYTELDGLIRDHCPDAIALEQLYAHYEHPRTAILMGHARGVIVLAAGLHDLPLHHYAATQVKSAITGNGRASKDQIQQMVKRTFHLLETPNPPDVSDAIAIALCHAYRHGSNLATRTGP